MSLGNEDLIRQRLYEKLMRSPRARNGNRGGVFQPLVAMAKVKALKHRLIQFNGPRYISYLVFDVDRPAAALAWRTPTCLAQKKVRQKGQEVEVLLDPGFFRIRRIRAAGMSGLSPGFMIMIGQYGFEALPIRCISKR